MVLWGVRAGAAVATLDAHEDKAWALAVDADGDRLAGAYTDSLLTST
jgi:U3 small nucleolar RNA-associated protein 13